MCAGCDSKKQSFLRLIQEKVVIRSSILKTGRFNQYLVINRPTEDFLRMNNRKVVHSQGRQIVYNVYQFMKKEKEEGLTIPLSQLRERVAEATGVSLSTVKRIIKEGKSTPETSQPGSSKFCSPRKNVTQPRPKSTLDAFDEEIIRKVIYSFINTQKCAPTISKVLEEVKSAGVEFEVIPNLPKNCVFVVDNASYHNVSTQALPTSSWKKGEMKKWLSERAIFYEPNALKVELYEKIKQYKPQHKVYILDQLLAENGHVVLRLPPYHPALNPIEKIWAIVKNRIAARNITFKMQDVRLADEEFEKITPENWKKVCEHVEQVESDYFKKEVILDDVAELIININNDSDESDLWFSSDDEDLGCEALP